MTIFNLTHLGWFVRQGIGPLFYLGPETIMPLASILAAVVGFLLIFWRAILNGVKKIFRKGQSPTDVAAYIEPEEEEEQ